MRASTTPSWMPASGWRWARRSRPRRSSSAETARLSTPLAGSPRSYSSQAVKRSRSSSRDWERSRSSPGLWPKQGTTTSRNVAYDTVAAIINDLCCVGARPLVVNAYFSTGKPDWFEHRDWHEQLIEGWFNACVDAGCTWGGGESPSLPELVDAGEIELAGSAVGVIPDKREPILGRGLAPGDEIVLVASSGLHANGSSLARMIAADLSDGYATRLPSGEAFGEALLRRSYIYSRLAESALDAGLPVTYMSHITGHGFLKLMRPRRELTYRIERLLPVPEVLEFLVNAAGMTAQVAYSTLNMGSGFAIYCAPGAGEEIVGLAAAQGFAAIVGGRVEAGARRVLIDPLGIELAGEELRLGPDR